MKSWTDASSGYNSRISALESAEDNSGFTYAGSYSTWAKLYLPENTPCSSGSKAMGKIVINATTETYYTSSYITIFDNSYFNIWYIRNASSTQYYFSNSILFISSKYSSSNGYSIIVGYYYGQEEKTINLNSMNGSYLIDMIRN